MFKSSAISGGFFRRMLENIFPLSTLLEHSKLIPKNIPKIKYDNSNKNKNYQNVGRQNICSDNNDDNNCSSSQGRIRNKIATCLHLVSALANHQSEKCSPANDLILLPEYDIMRICRDIIIDDNCPINDTLFISAMGPLSVLSKDNTR